MGRVIRAQGKGAGSFYKSPTHRRKISAHSKCLDYSESIGFIRENGMDVIREPGRGAPLCKAIYRHPFCYKQQKELFVAGEGMNPGQFVYCGKKTILTMGNVLPLRLILKGAIVCDRCSFDRASSNYTINVSHTDIKAMRTTERSPWKNQNLNHWEKKKPPKILHYRNNP